MSWSFFIVFCTFVSAGQTYFNPFFDKTGAVTFYNSYVIFSEIPSCFEAHPDTASFTEGIFKILFQNYYKKF